MTTVLVTDADERSALAAVRSLGRAGHRVITGAARARSLAGASRYSATQTVLPDALREPERFRGAVAEAVRTHGVHVVLPVTDASVSALLTDPAVLSPAILPPPTFGTYRRVSDKAAAAETAAALGIRVPRQVVIEAPEAAPEAAASLRPPFVLKPARSVAGQDAHRRKLGVVHAADVAAAAVAAARLPPEAFPLLLQERIVGPGTGVFLLVWQGRTIAAFAHERVREKPPAGGVSVVCRSVPLEPALRVRSEALLARFGFEGVAMVEFKRDSDTGEPVLMEVNARFWGSLQLAVDSGVDFPRLLVECATGQVPAPVTTYRVGVVSRWFFGDADHLLARLRRSPAALHLPPGAPSRLAALGAFLAAPLARRRGQVFQWGDPGPARRELLDRAAGLWRR